MNPVQDANSYILLFYRSIAYVTLVHWVIVSASILKRFRKTFVSIEITESLKVTFEKPPKLQFVIHNSHNDSIVIFYE